MKGDGSRSWGALRAWFALTRQEQFFLAGVLAIFLIGLTARYVHLRNERPTAYRPDGLVGDWGGNQDEQ